MKARHLVLLSSFLSVSAVVHQYLSTRGHYVFQVGQVLHHETAVVCIISFTLGAVLAKRRGGDAGG